MHTFTRQQISSAGTFLFSRCCLSWARASLSLSISVLHLPLRTKLFTMHITPPSFFLLSLLVHSSLAHTSATDYIDLHVWEGYMSERDGGG
ncbi:hypothetical protein BT69DRAFT_53785 [Atractiella rhizophila]|nr:hypothetical protein BT69DRAFT_53785 [Atractiella rhizophila]